MSAPLLLSVVPGAAVAHGPKPIASAALPAQESAPAAGDATGADVAARPFELVLSEAAKILRGEVTAEQLPAVATADPSSLGEPSPTPQLELYAPESEPSPDSAAEPADATQPQVRPLALPDLNAAIAPAPPAPAPTAQRMPGVVARNDPGAAVTIAARAPEHAQLATDAAPATRAERPAAAEPAAPSDRSDATPRAAGPAATSSTQTASTATPAHFTAQHPGAGDDEPQRDPGRFAPPDAPVASATPAHGQPAPQVPQLQGAQVTSDAQITPGDAQAAGLASDPTHPVAETRDVGGAGRELRALPELPARSEAAIVREAQLLARDGGGTARIQLEPPQLGGLKVHVTVNDHGVSVSMQAERLPVAEMLARNVSELRHSLEAHGMRIERFDVGADRSDDSSGSRSGAFEQARRESRAVDAAARSGLASGFLSNGAPLRPAIDFNTLGTVDVRV